MATYLSAASGSSMNLVNGTRPMGPMDEGYAEPRAVSSVLVLAW